jgi:hypothetical protein
MIRRHVLSVSASTDFLAKALFTRGKQKKLLVQFSTENYSRGIAVVERPCKAEEIQRKKPS